MDNLDLSILKKNPHLTSTILLEVEPLAPLSMVTELPGSYYKTLKIPNKKMLCGLFENLLGWHIDLADRKKISKDIKQLRNKHLKQKKKQESNSSNENVVPYKDYTKGSTYMPLLMDYFEIKAAQPVFSKVVFYDDLWSKAYRRKDSADTHTGGSSNLSHETIGAFHKINDKIVALSKAEKIEKNKKKKKELKAQEKESKKEKEDYFKKNINSFPIFYSTPTKREYVALDGKYEFILRLDGVLLKILQHNLMTNNLCYLGNSEGWVDLKFIEP